MSYWYVPPATLKFVAAVRKIAYGKGVWAKWVFMYIYIYIKKKKIYMIFIFFLYNEDILKYAPTVLGFC